MSIYKVLNFKFSESLIKGHRQYGSVNLVYNSILPKKNNLPVSSRLFIGEHTHYFESITEDTIGISDHQTSKQWRDFVKKPTDVLSLTLEVLFP